MPAPALRLSDRQLNAVKAKDKDYVLSDGDGLQLRARSNGSMLWNFNYREPVTKNRIKMGLGTYPELSLANARKKVVEARELLAQSIDPKVQRNAQDEAKRAETEHTFASYLGRIVVHFEKRADLQRAAPISSKTPLVMTLHRHLMFTRANAASNAIP